MIQNEIGIVCNRLACGGGMESHAISIVTTLANLGYTPVIFTKNHKPIASVQNYEIISCSTKMIPRALEDLYFSHWLKNKLKNRGIQSCIGFCRNTESDILFCGGTHRGFASHRKHHLVYDAITSSFEDAAFQHAKFILPASNFIGQELQSLYGINRKKIVTAYPPVSEDKFTCFPNQQRLEARADLGLSLDKTVLLFPSASGHERKGLSLILKCIEGMKNIELAIAGKPPRSLNSSAIAIGYQTDMAKAYNAADYTILASCYEPFGLVGVESVLCGTPVILAQNIGCTEVISSEACRTFDLDNPQQLRSILLELKPSRRTSKDDLAYDFSIQKQVEMLLSLLSNGSSA